MAFLHNLVTPLITLISAGFIGLVVYVFYINNQLTKHRKEIVRSILVTFIDRASHQEEEILCLKIDKYKIIPPGGDTSKKAKQASKDNPKGFYLLFGAAVKQPMQDTNGQPVVDVQGNQTYYTGSVTTRAVWPPGKPERTQVLIEHAFFNYGDPRPLNPFNNMLPVNSDEGVRLLADDTTMEAISQHIRADIEALLKMFEDVRQTAKNMKLLTYAVIGSVLFSGIGTLLTFLVFRKL